ncbi:hypothetical protein [Streptomyces sp. FR-008]|uniref:hypothetical protein n=1 Tax=Streptomyces sp. FR-008 TaxID=206662 RepID=UPI0007213144|nr:hypothetical protein [Streptomyces sp. FR-008]ALM41914.1 hypothetical protein SFR_5299 [Streptomyces sp. FR-008]KAF0794170.1 hypothetical protein P405_05145 [Streptomyces sp. FR-008]
MTEVAAERQVPAQAPPAPPPPDTSPNAPSTPAAKVDKPQDVQQTAGGWPVVPLALTGTNTTVAAASSAALVGAGPVVALAAAATGAAVLGAAALAGRRKDKPRKNNGAGRTRGGSGGFHRAAGLGRGGTRSGAGAGARSGRSSNGRHGSTGRGRSPLKSPSTGRTSLAKGPSASSRTGTSPGRSGGSAGRIQQVRALRQSGGTSAGSTRSQQRAQTAQARRQAADARRSQAATHRNTAAAGRGRIGRGVSAAVGRAARLRDRALEKTRARRDRLAKERLGRERRKVRTARIRRSARWALFRSALRFQHRRLWAALAAGALGVVGLVTTPLGRRLGWAWLQHPGRRLYRRLMGRARTARELRDAEIREAAGIAEAALHEAAERDGSEIADRVERPEPLMAGPASAGTGDTVSSTSGWKFEEAAAEMEAAAQAYQPDDCMEILAMVQGLPQALTSISNVMKILAERSDSEFPLEKEVADQFADLHGSLMGTVAVADDMENVFRQAHASDIARFEDPRNGYEAEKGWNI